MAPTENEFPPTRSLQKGSAELLVLSMLEGRDRHGYEIAQRIELLSEGLLAFQAATLYPLLYKLEERGLVVGRWIEKPGERRRRFYRLTAEGRRALGSQRRAWRSFFEAVERVGQLGRA